MINEQELIGENMETQRQFCPVCKDTQAFVETESPSGYLVCSGGCGFRMSIKKTKLVFTNSGYEFKDE